MKTTSSDNGDTTALPSALERQKIFYLLRRLSSITAWRRIFAYYVEWANVVEESVRTADANGWSNDTSLSPVEYARILEGLAHCGDGINRLSSGDKRVFKFDANGEFVMAARMLSHWSQMLDRIRIGENVIKEHTPLWSEFSRAVNSLAEAWGECGTIILEQRYLGDAPRLFYGDWLIRQLGSMWFPDQLPQVPDPVDSVFVKTGEFTPCSGIWEPVDVPKASFVSLLTRSPKPKPPFKVVGTMSYLHGGSDAPPIKVQTASETIVVNTTWRLLWEDDRYKDGSVPDEEAGYRFAKPETKVTPVSPRAVGKEVIWAESGTPAQFSGRWLAESDLSAIIQMQGGDILPLHEGRKIRWVLAENPT